MSKKSAKKHIVEIADEQRRYEFNTNLLMSVLYAIKNIKNQEQYDDFLGGCDYLFGQNERGYISSVKNWHISKEAKRVWEDITDENIHMCSYHEMIVAKHDFTELTYLSGSKKVLKSFSCKAGKKFRFNQLFIVEHTTPAADFGKALLKVYSATASDSENVEMFRTLLEKMHVTRILRREDFYLAKASHRLEVDDIINLSSEELFIKAQENMNYPVIEGVEIVDSTPVKKTSVASQTTSCFAKNSKFSFDGKNYFKMGVFFNKFVEQIIATRPEYTFEDIQSVFATRIFGMSKGCPSLATVDVFANTTRKNLKDRYKMSMPLIVNGVIFYTSTQWTRTSFEKLIEIANKFGYTVSNR